MQLQEIVIDHALRELTPRGTPSFPLEMYCNDITAFITRYVPWHWHKEMEFGYVVEGMLVIECENHKTDLAPGDGFLINSNQLHAMRPAAPGPCVTVNIVFDPEIVGGAPHSIYENKYVLPLTTDPKISIVPLFPSERWQASVLSLLKSAFETYTAAEYGYEMKLRSFLSQIWIELIEKMGEPTDVTHQPQNPHIKRMLTYIHKNYMQPLSLSDIAQSANIGVRTCCRCFKQQLGMTPFRYLMEYRVKIAAELLANTDRPVTEICFDSGFRDTSYFTKVFRELTGYTPSQFRKIQ